MANRTAERRGKKIKELEAKMSRTLSDKPEHFDYVMDMLKFIEEEDLGYQFWWRTDGAFAPITFFVNANDLFYWACGDAEEVTPDALPALKQAIADCKAIDPTDDADVGCWLFTCRIRKMRPQGAAYPAKKYWTLFDACGPEREIGPGNPRKPGVRTRDKTA